MSFDALTIGGLLAALASGGFLVGVVCNNDRLCRRSGRTRGDVESSGRRKR
jgi:hypothetical protein